MPTVAQINAVSNPLDAVRAARLKSVVKASQFYAVNFALLEDFETKIDALVGLTTTNAKYLYALTDEIDEIGDDTTKLKGGRDGVDYDPRRDIEALLGEAMGLLYPAGTAFTSMAVLLAGANVGRAMMATMSDVE